MIDYDEEDNEKILSLFSLCTVFVLVSLFEETRLVMVCLIALSDPV